jgi:type II secretory pathway pseudopilin PulG
MANPADRRFTSRQRGVGLIEAMLVTLLVGSALAAGFVWLQVDSERDQLREQRRSLTEAERALETFAMMQHRLPCPDTDGDGLEDTDGSGCAAANSKGSLPWQTLSIPDPAHSGDTPAIAYMVDDVGTSANLTRANADTFRYGDQGTAEFLTTTAGLARYTNAPGGASFRDTDTASAADLCRALAQTANDGGPQLTGSTGREVAYALAHPGRQDRDGDGRLRDGANADNSARMASLSRGAGPGYDDRVVAREHAGLARRLGCGPLIRSLEAVSLTVAAVEEVHAQHEWVTGAAEGGMQLSGQRLPVLTLATAAAAASATEDGIAIGRAAGECFRLPPDLGACVALPFYGGGLLLRGASVGPLVAASVQHGRALDRYRAIQARLDVLRPWDHRDALLDAADTMGVDRNAQTN